MIVVKKNPVPIYEVACPECKSVVRYRACEVAWQHIDCPVCGSSIWANTICPVNYDEIHKGEEHKSTVDKKD